MILSPRLILSSIAALSILCGCAGNHHSASSPKTAQYDLALDWQYALNPNPPKALGSVSLELGSVRSIGGTTYAASGVGKVIAIDEASALPRWSADLKVPVTAGPVVIANAVFVGLADGNVIKLNARSGEIIWKYDTGVAIENGLSVKDNIVACTNGNNRIFVIDAETGSLKWKRERARSQEFSMYGQAAPLIHNDVVYAGFSDGYLVAYAAQTGTAIWSRELAPESRFKDLDAHPVIIENTLFAASSSGGLYALAVDDGHTIWRKDILGISSIVPFQDSLYLASQSGIFKIRQSDGATYWQNVIQKDALISPLAIGKNYIYASVQRYGLVILDRRTGDTRHIIDQGSDFTTAPSLTNGALSVISNNATIYRFIVDDTPISN